MLDLKSLLNMAILQTCIKQGIIQLGVLSLLLMFCKHLAQVLILFAFESILDLCNS